MEIIGAIGLSNVAAITQGVVGTAVVGGVLAFELPSKVAGLNAGAVSVRTYVRGGISVVSRCLPECLGVCTILCLSVLLRIRGDSGLMLTDPGEVESWTKIVQEWPILMGADTLLNLQAMLRLLLLLFVGIRADSKGRSPLSGMASVFLLGSMLARGALSTRCVTYRLEGPLSLGGDLPIACEAAMVPFLAAIAYKALRRFPVAVAAIGIATAYSRCHYFNLAQNKEDDSLFTLAHILELFAAFAYLLRTISLYCTSTKETRSSGFVGFMQFLMPAQQLLAAFYWLTAFTPDSQLPIGAGKPWCLLIMTNLMQLACFLCALALYLGECFGVDSPSPPQEENVVTPEVEDVDSMELRTFAPMAGLATNQQLPNIGLM